MKNIFKSDMFIRVAVREKILFVKHLSIAIKSGMTLLMATQMIRSQSISRSFKKILDEVIKDLNNGAFLSTSLEKYHRGFGAFFFHFVGGGGAGGTPTG